ncbi:uncharacterized protein LOC115696432 [Cannabis sativa]|uniref:uncharacterized protein LOC115696432 n=1 Tax=Cannabis sativa TaxID=3483 RepID=UPI0011DFACAC|nr:uncharacterized protein LOC115696432 [Cannabis sativa]
MLFADDSYLFCQSTTSVAGSVSNLLNQFETASGQKVNFSKSTMFFSPNTCPATRVQICDILHMPEASEGSLYLGLPNIIGRNKNVVLGFLKTKVIAGINSWDCKLLSRAGKEILLKIVVQSLPTYPMSVFLLPLGTCNEIEKLMARFWWKTSSSKGKVIIWRSWDHMAAHKYDGGMGFRHLHDFNISMLAKQAALGTMTLYEMFNNRDSDIILGIPLSSNVSIDTWSWEGERTGEFSVKSAYNMLQQQKRTEEMVENSIF